MNGGTATTGLERSTTAHSADEELSCALSWMSRHGCTLHGAAVASMRLSDPGRALLSVTAPFDGASLDGPIEAFSLSTPEELLGDDRSAGDTTPALDLTNEPVGGGFNDDLRRLHAAIYRS